MPRESGKAILGAPIMADPTRSSDQKAPAVEQAYECDACGGSFEGRPAASGLFIWTRGAEVRYEQPPLCPKCAAKLSSGARLRWQEEE